MKFINRAITKNIVFATHVRASLLFFLCVFSFSLYSWSIGEILGACVDGFISHMDKNYHQDQFTREMNERTLSRLYELLGNNTRDRINILQTVRSHEKDVVGFFSYHLPDNEFTFNLVHARKIGAVLAEAAAAKYALQLYADMLNREKKDFAYNPPINPATFSEYDLSQYTDQLIMQKSKQIDQIVKEGSYGELGNLLRNVHQEAHYDLYNKFNLRDNSSDVPINMSYQALCACCSVYTALKTAPCGHAFCSDCWDRLEQSENRRCPFCWIAMFSYGYVR